MDHQIIEIVLKTLDNRSYDALTYEDIVQATHQAKPWKLPVSLPRTLLLHDLSYQIPIQQSSITKSRREYACKIRGCIFTTTKSDAMVRHIKYETLFVKFGTHDCTEKMRIKNDIIGSTRPLVCCVRGCYHLLKNHANLLDHHNDHFGIIPSMTCPVDNCSYRTSSSKSLRIHRKIKHTIKI